MLLEVLIMNKINLLPWRDDLLIQKRTAFRNVLFLSALMGLSIVSALHTVIKTKQSHQLNINQTIRNESLRLDKQIIELAHLISHKQKLISEIELIRNLQLTRKQIVKLLSELPSLLPNGIYLTQLSQTNDEIIFEGKTESNQQVSLFMQAIANSETLQSPTLQVIKIPEKITEAVPLNDFILTATLKIINRDSTDALE